jgi:hypothetical protein
MATRAASALGDHGTSATHLVEASLLAARMDTEVGAWANLVFGRQTSVNGVPISPLGWASTARPCRSPRRCTRNCCQAQPGFLLV